MHLRMAKSKQNYWIEVFLHLLRLDVYQDVWSPVVDVDPHVDLTLGDLGNLTVLDLRVKLLAVEHHHAYCLTVGLHGEAGDWEVVHHRVHSQEQPLKSSNTTTNKLVGAIGVLIAVVINTVWAQCKQKLGDFQSFVSQGKCCKIKNTECLAGVNMATNYS